MRYVYLHWDGYPRHAGAILAAHYRAEADVDALLALGALSGLGSAIGVQHTFRDRDTDAFANMCTAYTRDRGDEFCDAVASNVGAYAGRAESHAYLYRDGRWEHKGPDADGVDHHGGFTVLRGQ